MASRALFGALAAIAVFLMPAFAGTVDAPERKPADKQGTAAAVKPALPDEIAAPAAAPRAAQIEPVMVEPVKRVAPKVPVIKSPDNKIKQVVTIEKDPALGEQKKTSDNKKSCGAGQKRSGNSCTKVAANKPSGKKRR